MSEVVKVRFAPSPTGELHLGNARTAIFNWLFARNNKGRFVLRIEDTDRERSRPEYVESLKENLHWLGLDWDEGPFFQSERKDIYQDHVNQLKDKGLVYPCYCSSQELEERRKKALSEGRAPKYDNRCRSLSKADEEKFKREARLPVLRFKVEHKKISFHDEVRGDVQFDTSLYGDFVLFKSDGFPTFHFAVAVDDALMGITHVIRGEDHLSNVPRHLLLCEAMGFKAPQFAHLSMIMGPDRSRLSKRHGATSVTHYREKGYLSSALVNYLSLLGWSSGDDREIFSIEELIKLFSLKNITKSAAVFNLDKLNWVGSMHIRGTDPRELVQGVLKILKEQGSEIAPDQQTKLEDWVKTLRDRVWTLQGLADELLVYIVRPDWKDEKLRIILQKDRANETLEGLIETLGKEWTDELFPLKSLSSLQKSLNMKGGEFYPLIRIALTGMEQGPELKEMATQLGKNEVLDRLKIALENLNQSEI